MQARFHPKIAHGAVPRMQFIIEHGNAQLSQKPDGSYQTPRVHMLLRNLSVPNSMDGLLSMHAMNTCVGSCTPCHITTHVSLPHLAK
jgi:hypothetical protein